LRKLIRKSITVEEFEELKSGNKEIIITVSNLSKNAVEYKSLKDFDYAEFCDWIWISCNYLPHEFSKKKTVAIMAMVALPTWFQLERL
jgi:hypothetical protein